MANDGPLSGQLLLQKVNSGPPLKLTALIASSGEGAVYRTTLPGFVAKIHNAPRPEYFQKLAAMIARPPRDPAAPAVSIAWPVSILAEPAGELVGFLMPEIANAKRPLLLYVPKARLADASGVDWFYLHSAALNLARLFRAIHGFGYVVGDVKPENLLVNASMQVCAIDTDSFQVTDPSSGTVYRCTVGTPDYTPPELWGLKFEEIDRTVRHDLFGLAALIYLFLFGKHPFSGGLLPDHLAGMETGERIKNGLWQWNRAVPLLPHRGSVPLDIVHPRLEQLFRRCFDRGGQRPDMRPTAEEWESALEAAIEDLVWCPAAPLHVHASHRPCPWCESAKGGIDPFPGRGLSSSSFAHVLWRLDQHMKTGDFTAAAGLIERHTQLQTDPRASKARAETRKYGKVLAQFTRFRDAIGRSSDHDEENLMALRSTPQEVLALAEKNVATAPRMTRLRALARAIEDVDRHIRTASPKKGVYDGEAEQALLDTVRTHAPVLKDSPATFPRYKDRLKDARERVDALRALAEAETVGQARAIAAALEGHGPRLEELAQFRERAEQYRDLRRISGRLRDFIAAAARPGADPDIVCALWEAAPDLAEADIAREPVAELAHQRPRDVYEQFAARRKILRQLRQTLDRIAPPGTPLSARALEGAAAEVARHVQANGAVPVLAPLHKRIAALQSAAALVTRLRRLAEGGEAASLDLARAWRGHEGTELELDTALGARVATACRLLACVEDFAAKATSAECDETELVRIWSEGTLAHPAAAATRIDDMDIRQRVELARARIAAAAEMTEIMRATDAEADLTRAGERSLVAAWEARRDLLATWAGAQARLHPRVAQARDRLRRADIVLEAQDRPEDMARAWGTDGCLEVLAETRALTATAAPAAAALAALDAALAHLSKAPVDEAGALALLAPARQADAAFRTAPLATLEGRSLDAFTAHLEARGAFRRQLAACDPASAADLLALADAWDPEFGEEDASLAASPLLKDAIAFGGRWTLLRGAARTGDDTTVARMWGDARLETAPDFAAHADLVQAALQRYLDSGEPFHLLPHGEGATHHRRMMRLRWAWSDPNVTHAVLMIGDRALDEDARREAILRHVVSRQGFDAAGGAILALSGRMLMAAVFPAFQIGGRLVHAKRPVVIQEQEKRLLRYRLQSPAGDRQELELVADRALRLPSLRLLLEEGGAEVVEQFAPASLGTDGRIVIPLTPRAEAAATPKLVRLDYETPADAEWLEIHHPDPRERRMAVRR